MPILLVRHAVAASRSKWDGDDRLRPLTKRGQRQALDLVSQLSEQPVHRVLSSPYLRCVDTVAPLARGRRIEVHIDWREGCRILIAARRAGEARRVVIRPVTHR